MELNQQKPEKNLWTSENSRRLLARCLFAFDILFGNWVLFVFQKKKKKKCHVNQKIVAKVKCLLRFFLCLSLFSVIRQRSFIRFKSSYQFRRKLHAIKFCVILVSTCISCFLTWKKGVWVLFNYYSHSLPLLFSLSFSFSNGKIWISHQASLFTTAAAVAAHTTTTKTNLSQREWNWQAGGRKAIKIFKFYDWIAFLLFFFYYDCYYACLLVWWNFVWNLSIRNMVRFSMWRSKRLS